MIQRAKLISNATKTIRAFMRTLPVVQSGSSFWVNKLSGQQVHRFLDTKSFHMPHFIQLAATFCRLRSHFACARRAACGPSGRMKDKRNCFFPSAISSSKVCTGSMISMRTSPGANTDLVSSLMA